MRNYREQVEAAYLTSRRQGDLMRDPERERGTHDDRRNRYREEQLGTQRYPESGNEYQQQQQDHRGKGPRNYRRPDERVKEIVCDRLCDDPELDASDIEVEVRNCEVILSGWVEDRYAKRHAEDLAESIPGVTHVENRIRVNREKQQSYNTERVNQER